MAGAGDGHDDRDEQAAPGDDLANSILGLRIQEALALAKGDLGARRGSLRLRHGRGDRCREIGMDA